MPDDDLGSGAAGTPRPAPRRVGSIAVPARHHQHRTYRERATFAFKAFVALVAVAAVALTGTVWGYIQSTNSNLTVVEALDQDSTDIRDPDAQYGDQTYLLVGVDSRIGANANMGAGTTEWENEGARSDTIMLVNIPSNRERVVIVSFPRDLNVTRASCQRWNNYTNQYEDETVPSASNVKLNSAYYEGGPKCLIKMVQRLSGLRVSHFVGIDFAGFEAMVNEIGGVEVCTTEPLVDDELGVVVPGTGRQVIDGRTALDYVRARKVAAEGTNDYGRIKRQQLFLSSLLRTALSGKVLFDPVKLNGFITAFTRHTFVENVDTNSLLSLGRSLQGIDAGHVTFLTIPTDGTNEYVNEIPRPDDMRAIFDAIINDQPLPGEAPSPDDGAPGPAPEPAETVPAVSSRTVSVQVSNGSTTIGLAGSTASALAQYGFQIYNVTDYPQVIDQTVVRYSGANKAAAATLASAVPGAVLERVSGLGNIVELVVATDFQGTVKAPTRAGAQVSTEPTDPDPEAEPAIVELPEDLSVVNAADTSCA